MWLVWSALILAVLRYLEFGIFATVSWWWVIGLLVAAFIWFEFIERYLGLEKKRAMDEMDAAKEKRIKRALEQNRANRK
ncbi:MAG TPA: TIGR04438 family Trp-rich protein [Burkholderiaceae bacterium]|nr:TIGR04438 family Trp-rich protein [Burkholderiaceae bacterium]HYB50897.1 TIGR04438 family Trp-rich protein [Burkholderiaceae bacterium]